MRLARIPQVRILQAAVGARRELIAMALQAAAALWRALRLRRAGICGPSWRAARRRLVLVA